MEKKWFVYEASSDLVLSSYPEKRKATKEAERVREEATDEIEIMVLPRSDARIKHYAESHPHWARVHGYERERFREEKDLKRAESLKEDGS